jgi:hypothetical protein
MATPAELLTVYDVPVDDQTRLTPDWYVEFLSTLQGRPPICVLLLLADYLITLPDINAPTCKGGGQLEAEFGLKKSKGIEVGATLDNCKLETAIPGAMCDFDMAADLVNDDPLNAKIDGFTPEAMVQPATASLKHPIEYNELLNEKLMDLRWRLWSNP